MMATSVVARTAPPRTRAINQTDQAAINQRASQHLAKLLARVEGIALSPSTVRSILQRRRDDLAELESVRRQHPRTIVVPVRMLRWGVDLTLVWVLGVLPVWLIGTRAASSRFDPSPRQATASSQSSRTSSSSKARERGDE